MYRKDYFLKLTQQFAQMLARLIGLKEKGETNKAFETIDEVYKELFKIEKEKIQAVEEEGFAQQLQEQYKFTHEQLEILARLLYEEAELIHDPLKSRSMLKKGLNILELLNSEQRLYSFERESLIKSIQDKLSI